MALTGSRLRSALGRRPALWSAAAGGVAALATVAAALLLDARSTWREHEQRHDAAAAVTQRLAADTNRLLDTLIARGDTSCSDASLTFMRSAVFGSEFQRDVGVIDADGKLVCTTTHGRLPAPVGMPQPDVEGRMPDGTYTAFWVAQRVMADNGSRVTSIVQRGRFNTVIDPRVTQTLLTAASVDPLIWWRDANDRMQPLFQSPLMRRLQAHAATLASMPEGQQLQWWSGEGLVWVRTSAVPQSRLTLQTVAPLFNRGMAWTGPLALLAAGLGLVVSAALRPRLRRFGEVEYRLAQLLRGGAVNCRYQPIVDLQTGRPVGCEVLMRLRDGDQWVMPDQVMAAVVRQGLTWVLDEAVIRRAMGELQAAFGPDTALRLSFNLFPSDIDRRRVSALFAQLQALQPRPRWVVDLEVIEREYDERTIRELAGLREDGFAVSVDDFGTGYSNLASIRAFAPTYLKIDRSFVTDMESATVRSCLIPEMVALAQAVGAKVIAEGVENTQQRDRLRAFGVAYAQGYLFARPLDIEAFRDYWTRSAAPDGPPQTGTV